MLDEPVFSEDPDIPIAGEASSRRWRLTQAGFDRLLACLDSDRERAGRAYELLRSKLIDYFDWRNVPSPEQYADEAIDRVAKKIADGEQIREVGTFVFGIARMMLHEIARSNQRERTALSLLPSASPVDTESEQADRRVECLTPCLDSLTQNSRALIIQYYHGERGRNKIDTRRELAERLGIQANALRIRACRVREKLEQCMQRCLAREQQEA
jgi:DNA-directed RNA polymerase specialized sigma24 family protein